MIHKVKLTRKQKLSMPELYKMCSSARGTYDYVRINLINGKFIQVNFHRDQTISVCNNFTDLGAFYAVQNIMKRNKINSTQNIAEFLFKMVQRYNR